MRHSSFGEKSINKVLTFELISFVSLFSTAAVLLEYHRYQTARLLFSFGCVVFAAQLLMWSYRLRSSILKWATIVLIYVGTSFGESYLLGIADDAQNEYQQDLLDKEKDKYDKFMATHRTPKPGPSVETAAISENRETIATAKARKNAGRETSPPEAKRSCQTLSECSDEELRLRCEQLANHIAALYTAWESDMKKIEDDDRETSEESKKEPEYAEGLRFVREARTDIRLEEYRGKYRSDAQECRGLLAGRIGPGALDARQDYWYQVHDKRTQRSEDERLFFLTNVEIRNLPEVAADLKRLVERLHNKR